ncbi:hypothetical protein ACFY0F_03520 [Streptomyces sp. NPDC001544]|uniref:hypothetical protein n=1 Tax=Streptomyces sp. NPDC001544 TaxID=3364584 RepID=UPI003698DE43
MSIRPWVVVEAPDGRGLRRVTVGSDTVGGVWSLRELRRLLARLGHPDVDVDDPAYVYWRGGGSDTWPDRTWRRRTAGVLMVTGLFASAALNVSIGRPDVFGALTFAQRVTGAVFVLSGLVQIAAAAAALDHWGKRRSRISGAVSLLGVLIALATDSLLILMWLDEREYTRYMLAFMPLWCWSVWALCLLLRERPWAGVPHPRKFAAGVAVSALFTALSLTYSTMYAPTVAPLHFTLDAEFGTARADPRHPFLQVPLKLSVKNTGAYSVYIVIDDFSVYGRTATYSEKGDTSADEWERSVDRQKNAEDSETNVDQLSYTALSRGRFYEPGQVLESGQEDTQEHVLQVPRSAPYDLLSVDLQLTFMRKDRGRIEVSEFEKKHPSWDVGKFHCLMDWCRDRLLYLGRVHHNNNLVNVTHGPRYVLAGWGPSAPLKYSISSYHFESPGRPSSAEEKREVERFGLSTVHTSTEVSLAELTRSISAPRPS